jgi:DNA-binding transcriptional ArsR family regulator
LAPLSEKELTWIEDKNIENLTSYFKEELMDIYLTGQLPDGLSYSQKYHVSKRFLSAGLIVKKYRKNWIGRVFYELTPTTLKVMGLKERSKA